MRRMLIAPALLLSGCSRNIQITEKPNQTCAVIVSKWIRESAILDRLVVVMRNDCGRELKWVKVRWVGYSADKRTVFEASSTSACWESWPAGKFCEVSGILSDHADIKHIEVDVPLESVR